MYDKDRYIPVPKYSCTIWEGGFPVLFTSLYCTRKAAVDWNTADSVREKCDWVLSSPWMAFGGKPSVVLQRRQQSKNPCHRGDMMRCNIHQGQGDKWFIQKLNARTHASSQKRKDFNRLLSSHCFPIHSESREVLNVCRKWVFLFFSFICRNGKYNAISCNRVEQLSVTKMSALETTRWSEDFILTQCG